MNGKQTRLGIWVLRDLALPAAFLALGLGFAPGYLTAVLVCVGLAAGTWLGRQWLENATSPGWQGGLLAGLATVASLGMMNGAAPAAMLIALVFGLAWWDLTDFTRRLDAFAHPVGPMQATLIQAHVRRLALALGLGLLLGLAALAARLSLTLESAMLLGGLAVMLLRIAIGRMMRG